MQEVMRDKHREMFQRLVEESLPKLIAEHSGDILPDYSAEFEMFPLNQQDVVTEQGTDYLPVRARCVVTNKVTREVVEFNVELLHLPVFYELGFKIHGNYMQMLDLYERAYGWSFHNGMKDRKRESKATLLGVNGKSLSFIYDGKETPMVKFGLTREKTSTVSVSTFFRALTGYTDFELLEKFGSNNPFVMSAFSGNAKLKPEVKKGYAVETRTDCIVALSDAMFGKNRTRQFNNVAVRLREIEKNLFDARYLNLGGSNDKRFEYVQSYLYRAINKTLAKRIECNGYVFEEGQVLTAADLRVLDSLPLVELPVVLNGKIYNLKKF